MVLTGSTMVTTQSVEIGICSSAERIIQGDNETCNSPSKEVSDLVSVNKTGRLYYTICGCLNKYPHTVSPETNSLMSEIMVSPDFSKASLVDIVFSILHSL
jgi:hypothetical protein